MHSRRPGGWWRVTRWLWAASLSLTLGACQAATPTTTELPFFPTHTSGTLATATSTETAVPSEYPTLTPVSLPSPLPSVTRVPTVASDPFQLTYPTQVPVPIITWRPPLYPTPWAPTPYDHFYFASPIAADEINAPVADYRYGGMFFEDVVHTGLDIPAPKGTPVLATGAGTVIWAGHGVYLAGKELRDPYGLAVVIRHDFGYQNQPLYTLYGHMDQVDVIEGQHVETGDVLGKVGETGVVTGPHLHFEVRVGENSFFATRNPELWLVPPIGWGVIVGRVTDTIDRLLYDQMVIITHIQSEENLFAWSYGEFSVNSDKYYQENLVIGSIPAGRYRLRTAFAGINFSAEIEVYPGMVSYFIFRGLRGFQVETLPLPQVGFTPAPLVTSIP